MGERKKKRGEERSECHVQCTCIYMEIHVHSTLAKEYKGRKVIPTQTNKGTHTLYITHKKLKIENCTEK